MILVMVMILVMLPASKNLDFLLSVKSHLINICDAFDLGVVKCFLNLSVRRDRSRKKLWLNQTRYAVEVFERVGIVKARPLCLPMTRDLHLHRGDAAEESALGPFSEAVGCLMYLMPCTRPDLAQSVGALSRYVSDPRRQHWEAVKKVLRYVKSHSVYEKCVAANTVALSTMEAEYMAAVAAAREALWLKPLLVDYGVGGTSMRNLCDCQCARTISFTNNPIVFCRGRSTLTCYINLKLPHHLIVNIHCAPGSVGL
jgi:hypothetical protein